VGGSALLVGLLFWDRRSSNWHGAALIALYGAVAVAFFFAGDRG
jgi:Ca2+/H+ antiporter